MLDELMRVIRELMETMDELQAEVDEALAGIDLTARPETADCITYIKPGGSRRSRGFIGNETMRWHTAATGE